MKTERPQAQCCSGKLSTSSSLTSSTASIASMMSFGKRSDPMGPSGDFSLGCLPSCGTVHSNVLPSSPRGFCWPPFLLWLSRNGQMRHQKSLQKLASQFGVCVFAATTSPDQRPRRTPDFTSGFRRTVRGCRNRCRSEYDGKIRN